MIRKNNDRDDKAKVPRTSLAHFTLRNQKLLVEGEKGKHKINMFFGENTRDGYDIVHPRLLSEIY